MSSQQRADLAGRNAATCQTLFPNHNGKEFNSCLQNALDPAFVSDQAMIVKQMHDSSKWWKVGLKIGLGVILVAGVVAGVLIEPCGAIAAGALEVGSALLEATSPIFAPGLYGLIAATGSSFLIGGGVAVAEYEIGASIESDLVSSNVESSALEDSALSDLKEPEEPVKCASLMRLAAVPGIPCDSPKPGDPNFDPSVNEGALGDEFSPGGQGSFSDDKEKPSPTVASPTTHKTE